MDTVNPVVTTSKNFYELEPQTGQFISSEHRRIAEVINDYNQYMQLVWIPPAQRALSDEFPFAILHSPPGKNPYIVRKLRESELDHRLIAWLAMHDLEKQGAGSILKRLEAEELARQTLEQKRLEEARAERKDFAAAVIGGKNYFRHGGKKYS